MIESEILAAFPEIAGVHPATEAMPMASADDYADLVKDIREHGLAVPIVLDEKGMLLDGRNRLRALYEARVDARFQRVHCNDPWMYVWSLNGARRHLTVGQKAAYAYKWEEALKAKAKERQRAAGKNHGRGQKIASGNVSLSYQQSSPQSRDQAGDKAGKGNCRFD